MIHNVGPHLGGGEENLEKASLLRGLGMRAVQIFAHSPMVRGPAVWKSSFGSLFDSGLDVVIHSPYWVSIFNGEPYNLSYLKLLQREFCPRVNKVLYVSHMGHKKGVPVEKSFEFLSSLERNLEFSNFQFLLENEAGSKNSQVSIKDMIEMKRAFPWVGLCLDTEHAYAAGEDLRLYDLDNFDIIHLNGIPPYVRKGGHFDRHSYTTFGLSKVDVWWVIDRLRDCKRKVVILERRDFNIILKDWEILKGAWDA